jgi:hypothetical protein
MWELVQHQLLSEKNITFEANNRKYSPHVKTNTPHGMSNKQASL